MARTGFHEFNYKDADGNVWEVRLDSQAALPGDDTDIVARAPDGQFIQFLDGVQSDTAIKDAIESAAAQKKKPAPQKKGLSTLAWIAIIYFGYRVIKQSTK